MDTIEDTIRDFISREIIHSSVNEELANDQPLLAEGILDSLGLQQLITFLEGKYELMVDYDYLMPDYFESVQTIADLIREIQNS